MDSKNILVYPAAKLHKPHLTKIVHQVFLGKERLKRQKIAK